MPPSISVIDIVARKDHGLVKARISHPGSQSLNKEHIQAWILGGGSQSDLPRHYPDERVLPPADTEPASGPRFSVP
jgi:hypothetical protein